jgi:hypothetical protein
VESFCPVEDEDVVPISAFMVMRVGAENALTPEQEHTNTRAANNLRLVRVKGLA